LNRENQGLADFISNQASEVENTKQQWLVESQSDPEVGGTKFKEAAAYANRVFQKYGTPKLKAYLEETRLGNHPEVVRLLSRAGRELFADDTFERNGNIGDPKLTHEEILYGNNNKN
jgi:hypothetical protein